MAAIRQHDSKSSFEADLDEKKPQFQISSGPLSPEDREWLHSVDEKTARKIYHKVDLRLVPMLAILYLIAHLDRVSRLHDAQVTSLERYTNLEFTGEHRKC